MTQKSTQRVWIFCFLFAAFLIPYFLTSWWRYIPTTFLIFFSIHYLWPKEANAFLGWKGGVTLWVPAFFLFATTLVFSRVLITSIAGHHGWVLQPTSDLLRPLFPFFQTLNEELVFRALLLNTLLARRYPKQWASLATAAIFVLAHVVLYPLSQGGPLSVMAIATLFFLALSGNELFLWTGSIALPWAIHAGWNLSQYGWGKWVGGAGVPVIEATSFNVFVGDTRTCLAAIILASLAFAANRYRKRTKKEIIT